MPCRTFEAITLFAVLGNLLQSAEAQSASLSSIHRNLVIEQHRLPHFPRRLPAILTVSLVPIGPSILTIGTPIAFKVTTSLSGYIHLYALDVSGKSQVWLENVKLRANTPATFPPPGLTVRATPPAGDEIVIVAVTRVPMNGFAGSGATMMPFDTQFTHDGFRRALAMKTSAFPRSSWASTEAQIRIQN